MGEEVLLRQFKDIPTSRSSRGCRHPLCSSTSFCGQDRTLFHKSPGPRISAVCISGSRPSRISAGRILRLHYCPRHCPSARTRPPKVNIPQLLAALDYPRPQSAHERALRVGHQGWQALRRLGIYRQGPFRDAILSQSEY